MTDVYPEYADKVDFYTIGQSPFETIEQMEEYRISQGYPWPVAEINQDILKDLQVFQHSTKIVLDHQGIITYRAGYGDGGASTWHGIFKDLVEKSGG
ncbi:MAG: hypothetical protein CL759_06160 [Chloroflexi bacterium]|nr:hypothetical protein [Chloroflexota bacterium]